MATGAMLEPPDRCYGDAKNASRIREDDHLEPMSEKAKEGKGELWERGEKGRRERIHVYRNSKIWE